MVTSTDMNKLDNSSAHIAKYSNNTIGVFDSSKVEDTFNRLNSILSDDIFSMGLDVLYGSLQVLQSLADQAFQAMKARSKYANETQGMSNQVDSVIAEATKGDDKTKKSLPDSVINFMRDNGISVDGMSIDEYLKKNGPELDKGKLQAVKSALDNEKNRVTDTMTQDQLQLQKYVQSYNVTASNISTLQTGLKDLLTTIARNFC
ncbi:type III secretion system translocon protein SseB [Yersinia pekkanenii]|uniref:Methyl-accepting chemotaxis protein n=1 Tax=Yersinia pekkanenii TaxID=1288385 RepID=A0A0T9QRE7_9GAMM|nr:chemotaxis protein [Yersinia pekkanenii]CNI24709.1 Methyl-accepting chemotaxis protein [Yersinia pekkanenii]CRY68896.1 Methyl-accepting chemotaxis protein [Yersinia pekkanenii]